MWPFIAVIRIEDQVGESGCTIALNPELVTPRRLEFHRERLGDVQSDSNGTPQQLAGNEVVTGEKILKSVLCPRIDLSRGNGSEKL